jgi:tyrosine-specific transport protein
MERHNKLFGGILLVSGTTIGAGMLALPVCTGLGGFIPSVFLICAYWMYMTFTAFLMLEVTLWMGKSTNLISMAKNTLGKGGEVVSWITYLFLLYSLTTAYFAGSGPIVTDFIYAVTGISVPFWVGSAPLLLIFGFFVYRGTKSVDYVNRILMLGLVIAYFMMVVFLAPHVEKKLLMHVDVKYVWLGVSVIATSFGFHIIIPSLTTYLDRDISLLKKAILIGSIIPLIVYILWEFLALGIIPLEGSNGIREGYSQGENGAHLLTTVLGNTNLAMIARFFSFFAIVTSFLGVSLSLFDFLADGLRIPKTEKGRIFLYIMTFAPPLLITLFNPKIFLTALEYAGAFGVIILLGLMPALMVWFGRYKKNYKSDFETFGGKFGLIMAIVISVVVISMEIIKLG